MVFMNYYKIHRNHTQHLNCDKIHGSRAVKMNIFRKIIRKIREGYLKEMYNEIKWMYQYAKKYWTSICFYIVAGVFGIVMSLGGSIISKNLIDAITGTHTDRIGILAGLMIAMAVGNIAANAVISRISARINVVIQNELQADIYKKVMNSDWESLHEFRSGDLLNRLNHDANQVASSIISWIPNMITKMCQFIGALVIILYYDATMACIALLSAPVTILMSKYLMTKMRSYNKEMREISSEIMSFQNDSFQNLQTVKAFGLMRLFQHNLEDMQEHYKDRMMDYNKFSVYTSSFLSLVGLIVSYICFGWSAYRLWTGYITVGTLMMFLQMSSTLSNSFNALIQLVPSAISATTCAGRLMAIAELEKEQILESDKAELLWNEREKGITVKLENVDVIYKEGNQVLANGDFHAGQGEIVAIIGPSGEGKTTLMRIFLGLIYPTKGKAELTSHNGIDCTISSATRKFFGYVPQGNTVFTGTIAENMRMVKKDATDQEIIEALKIGCAYEFIEQLPQGIHSAIGERGIGFSEGQAQRIAIARAVLRDAPILLLDEATSALDIQIEEQVLKNIMNSGKNKTCIVTTHRPSVLSMSHHIYEIKHNHLVKKK